MKWLAVAGTFPPSENLQLRKTGGKRTSGKGKMSGDKSDTGVTVAEDSHGIRVNTGAVTAYIPRSGKALIDSIVMADGTRIAESGRLVASAQGTPGMVTDGVKEYTGVTATAEVERAGARRAVVKLTGKHRGEDGREWLPFTVRLYFYANSPEVRMTHTFVYDGDQDKDFIRGLGVSFDVPMRDEVYNRHVAFSTQGAECGASLCSRW